MATMQLPAVGYGLPQKIGDRRERHIRQVRCQRLPVI
jgi:hypothetical protein